MPILRELRRRIIKIHMALEMFIEAIFCKQSSFETVSQHTDSNGYQVLTCEVHIRYWNPATWVAWSRTMIFGDICGSAWFKRPNRKEIRFKTVSTEPNQKR